MRPDELRQVLDELRRERKQRLASGAKQAGAFAIAILAVGALLGLYQASELVSITIHPVAYAIPVVVAGLFLACAYFNEETKQ